MSKNRTSEVLKSEKIEEALHKNHRQYLLGGLALPQDLKNIADSAAEAGITTYAQYGVKKAHYHARCA